MLGFDHSDLGRMLAQSWNLPPSLEEVLAYHHVPWKARRYPVETGVVHIADSIVHGMQLGNSGEQYFPSLDEKVWELVDLPASVLSSTSDKLRQEFEDVVQSLWEM
jgi:HD-like signal output (HDOD) protein